jgi:hypothetical protein
MLPTWGANPAERLERSCNRLRKAIHSLPWSIIIIIIIIPSSHSINAMVHGKLEGNLLKSGPGLLPTSYSTVLQLPGYCAAQHAL